MRFGLLSFVHSEMSGQNLVHMGFNNRSGFGCLDFLLDDSASSFDSIRCLNTESRWWISLFWHLIPTYTGLTLSTPFFMLNLRTHLMLDVIDSLFLVIIISSYHHNILDEILELPVLLSESFLTVRDPSWRSCMATWLFSVYRLARFRIIPPLVRYLL